MLVDTAVPARWLGCSPCSWRRFRLELVPVLPWGAGVGSVWRPCGEEGDWPHIFRPSLWAADFSLVPGWVLMTLRVKVCWEGSIID